MTLALDGKVAALYAGGDRDGFRHILGVFWSDNACW